MKHQQLPSQCCACPATVNTNIHLQKSTSWMDFSWKCQIELSFPCLLSGAIPAFPKTYTKRELSRFALFLQVTDDANVMLNGFGTVVNSLQMRAKPYLPQFCGIIKWRLNNKNAKLRQQAADLIARIAIVMKVTAFCPFCSYLLSESEENCRRDISYCWNGITYCLPALHTGVAFAFFP